MRPERISPRAGRSSRAPARVVGLARELDRRHNSPLATVSALARRPAAAMQTAGYLARLSTVSVSLSDGPAGETIRSLLAARTLSLLPTGRLAQAVLVLDGDFDATTRGPQRQALRTNLRRGHAIGLAVHRVPDLDCFLELARDVGVRRGDDTATEDSVGPIDPAIHRGYVVTDPRGVPEGYLLLAVDTHTAWMLRSVGAQPGKGAALCHYLLHAAAVRDLVQSRVRCLVADGGLSVPDGIGYLQRRLGYRVCNIRIA
ncbi:MAG TPA: hypothetical protein VHW92_06405 [Mycobacteriales bacterium]|nr:hypothetical protein [Mycobacteriales bacterium]